MLPIFVFFGGSGRFYDGRLVDGSNGAIEIGFQ